MSTDIDFERVAFRYNAKQLKQSFIDRLTTEFGLHTYDVPDGYLLLSKIGNNRCFDENDRIAKQWTILAAGDYCAVLSRVVEHSKATIGLMLRFANGNTTPSGYIKRYEETLKSAIPLDDILASGWLTHLSLTRFGVQDKDPEAGAEQVMRRLEQRLADMCESKFGSLARHLSDVGRLAIEPSPYCSFYGEASGAITLRIDGTDEDADLAKVFFFAAHQASPELVGYGMPPATVRRLNQKTSTQFQALSRSDSAA